MSVDYVVFAHKIGTRGDVLAIYRDYITLSNYGTYVWSISYSDCQFEILGVTVVDSNKVHLTLKDTKNGDFYFF